MSSSRRTSYIWLVGALFLCFAALARSLFVPLAPDTVVINEAMAANGNVFADEDDDFEDWVELYNPGAEPVWLAGYSLSDRPDLPRRWIFPDVTIAAGGHVLVWASGKNYLYVPGRAPDDFLELVVASAGAQDGNGAALRLEGEDFSRNEIGINLALFDAAASHIESRVFATHAAASASAELVEYLESLPAGHFVMMAIKGDGSAYLSDAAVARLRDMGSEYADQLEAEDSWGIIVPVGARPIAEVYSARGDGTAVAQTYTSPELHTNFRLRQGGEFVGVYDGEGRVVDTVSLENQTRNVSWGRRPDGMPKWCHYAVPTPRAPNPAICTPAAATPMPSQESGFYGEPVALSFGNSVVSEIRYTLDGSLPTRASPRYSGSIELQRTAVVRARAYRNGFTPSAVTTHTYFIDEQDMDVVLPVVSLVTDPASLWDEETGIYVEGPDPDAPNFEEHGMAWERPAVFEIFDARGTSEVSAGAGVRVFGGVSRGFPKKNFVLYFRPQYGTAELDFQMFPGKPVTRFRSLVLRMGGDDGQYDFPRMRDSLMHTLWGEVGGLVSATRPVFVFVNGAAFGIYNVRERVDVDYLANNYGHRDVDLVRESDDVRAGELGHWEATLEFFGSHDLREPENFERAGELIDIENFTDFYLFQIYAGNIDLVEPNLIKYRPRTADGRWRWLMLDVDVSFGFASASPVDHNTLAWHTRDRARPDLGFYNDDGGETLWATLIIRRLLEVDEYRAYFRSRFAELLDTTLSPTHVVELIDTFAAAIEDDIERDLRIWRHEWEGSVEGWREEVDKLRDFARRRPDYLRAHARAQFDPSER